MGIPKLLRQVKAWGHYRSGLRIDLENPQRFAQESGRRPYLGLVPKQETRGASRN